MPMFIEIFLMLCIIAQPNVCTPPQPPNSTIPAESATVEPKSTIFSLINNAENCTTAYESLKSEQRFRQLEEYCERPLPGTPRADEFLSYEMVLCMVLYDAVQRVCKVGHQEVTKDIQNVGNFSCDTMIGGVPEASVERTKQWVTLFKTKLGDISDCQRECIQDKMISPVCEYIWKANTLTAQVSSAISAAISPTENAQVNSTGHGKTNRTMTSKVRPSEAKTFDLEMKSTNKSAVHKGVDHAETNGNITQSGSANDVNNNVKEQAPTKDSKVQNDFKKKQAQATVTTGHNDTKKQAHTAGNNTQNDINKQAHGKNSNVEYIAINSSNQSGGVTPHDAPVSLSVSTEHTPETSKYDNSAGKSTTSDSKSNTAPQSENKSSAGVSASDQDMENQNDGNEDFLVSTDENANKDQDTDVGVNNPSGGEDQEDDGMNIGQEEQGDQVTTHQEKAETDDTAQFNQLGDAADSHFYAYFMTMVVICIIGYLVFHNKQKILALALEGRSRRGTRRRPNTSAYRKLDSNLEEAVTSTGNTSVTHVIY